MATVATRMQKQYTRPDRETAQAANRRRRKRRRQGRRTIHLSVLIAFAFLLVGILSLTVFFKIEDVVVVGSEQYAPNEIAQASGIEIGENLFRVRTSDIESRLKEQFPYIHSVEVQRKLPPKIELRITQEKPEGAIRQGEQVALINREGKVLEKGIILVPEHIPLVKGISIMGVNPGDVLGQDAQEKLVMFRYLLSAMEEADFVDITNVDLTDRLNIRIMYENRIKLELGSEAELPYKLKLVKKVLNECISAEETGTLDATEYYRQWVTFRPSGEQDKDRMYNLEEGSPAEEVEMTDLPDELNTDGAIST